MKNRTFELVSLLSKPEASLFREHLSKIKRKSLLVLFNELKKIPAVEEEINKKALYEKVFGKRYVKAKDFLLRNELRLLAQELTGFVSLETMKRKARTDEVFGNRFWVEWLFEKNAWRLAEDESLKFIEQCNELHDDRPATEMMKRYIDFYVLHKEATAEHYRHLLGVMDNYYATGLRDYLHRLMEVKMKQAFAERTMQVLEPGYAVTSIESSLPDITKAMADDTYLQFSTFIAESYRLKGEEKIVVLKKAYAICEYIYKKGFEKNATRSSISALIALEYFLAGRYAEAVAFHKQALSHSEGLNVQNIISYVFNYLSTIIRLKDYREAIALTETYKHVWNNVPRVVDRFLCLKAMCHIFMGEHEQAHECIPANRKRGGIDHYYYYRFIQIIVYVMRAEYALAASETESFIHTIRNNDGNKVYLKLALMLKKYLTLLNKKTILDKREYAEKCRGLVQQLTSQQTELEQADNALLYRWLHGMLELGA